MDDSFSLGQHRKKRRGRVAAPPRHAAPARPPGAPPAGRTSPSHARKSSFPQTRLILGAVALAVAVVLIWALFRFMANAGNEAATRESEAIGRAQQVQAQITATSAITAAQAMYAEVGSFEGITAEGLKSFEPTFSYTEGESTDPNTVSVTSTSEGVGLAVRSSSGSCLYAHIAANGVTYGTGPACTGGAALEASKRAWPTSV